MNQKPVIRSRQQLAKTRLFCVEQLELTFSNGAERVYERMVASGHGAVMIVALNSARELLLVREYCAGTDDYQLAFPKGLVEPGEGVLQAANRELKEEVGFGAHQLRQLKTMSLAPGYFSHRMQLVLAEDLYPEKLAGDEPEPLEVVPWPLDQVGELLERDDFSESRSIAALMMVAFLFQQE